MADTKSMPAPTTKRDRAAALADNDRWYWEHIGRPVFILSLFLLTGFVTLAILGVV